MSSTSHFPCSKKLERDAHSLAHLFPWGLATTFSGSESPQGTFTHNHMEFITPDMQLAGLDAHDEHQSIYVSQGAVIAMAAPIEADAEVRKKADETSAYQHALIKLSTGLLQAAVRKQTTIYTLGFREGMHIGTAIDGAESRVSLSRLVEILQRDLPELEPTIHRDMRRQERSYKGRQLQDHRLYFQELIEVLS